VHNAVQHAVFKAIYPEPGMTFQVRLGVSEVNIDEIVDACVDGGAMAITIHGRTQQQRF
jgi:tRNA-dihydrouridine synthase